MRAPFDGEIISHDIVVGEIASTTTPQFVLADVRRLWVMLDVGREHAGLLALGQEVTFLPDGMKEDPTAELALGGATLGLLEARAWAAVVGVSAVPVTARGRLNWISLEVDEKTRTVKARAEVFNPQRRLRPHTFGNGRILVRSHSQALVVPTEALQSFGPSQLLFVQDPDAPEEFQPRVVQTGIRDDRCTEILSGVSPDETVVTTGSHVLKTELLKDRVGKAD